MPDALQLIWPLLQFANPIATNTIVAAWDPAELQSLIDLGFVQTAENAARVLCPECGEHEEEVVVAEGRDGLPRFFVPCPAVLRASVPPAALRQWTVQSQVVAETLATALGLAGACKTLLPGRLWRLGRTDWRGESRDVLLACGLHCDDGAVVRAEIVRGRKPIVFTPHRRPPEGFWLRRAPPVLALSQFAVLRDGELEIDGLAVATAIRDAEGDGVAEATAVTHEQLTLMIRRQIKAEQKSELMDDVFVMAYRRDGSYREAARRLTEETGRVVSKDAVARAVRRAGGFLAGLNGDDSDSIVRGVASRRRDRKGKSIIKSKDAGE